MAIDLPEKRRRKRPDLAERNRLRATHGLSGSTTRKSWEAMIRRCANTLDKDYPRYGGRGIQVCERWQDFHNFVADMGIKPAGTSLDRIDVNGNYEPSNCRWETAKGQANNRRSNVLIAFNGRSQTTAEWARELGICPKTLRYRIRAGWSLDDALSGLVDRAIRRAA
jgi:hypothetical protein